MNDTTAAQTLDLIREGGSRVVMLAFQRLEETRSALQEGRFDAALTRCQEAQGCIAQLASAQSSLGVYGRNIDLVRAIDIEEGANVCQVGIVKNKAIESDRSPGSFDKPTIVTLEIEGSEEPMKYLGERQLLVWVE